jgi:hypothetical protein
MILKLYTKHFCIMKYTKIDKGLTDLAAATRHSNAFLTSHCPVFDLPEARSRIDDGTPRVPTPISAPERDARVKVGLAAAKRLP